MRKFITIITCICLGLCMIGCSGGDGKESAPANYVMKLSLTSDAEPTISVNDTYKLKYSLNVGVKEDVVPAEISGEAFAGGVFDNVTNIYRPEREGKALLRLVAKYKDKTESLSVTVTVTKAVGGATGGDGDSSGNDSVVSADYPANPEFNRLQARPNDFTTWTEFGTHDPSLIQVDDVYYAFSTDVDATTKGYQIRKSLDGIHWDYSGAAFADPMADVSAAVEYLNLADDFSFWAPDIVRGTDGQFWLYYSITSAFGSSKSYIGLAKASDIMGPYKHAGMVVCSTTDGENCPNAIDPQVVIDGNGDYWLSWGSFMKGIYVMRLDNKTGLPLRDAATLAAYKAGDRTIGGKSAAVTTDFVNANKAQLNKEKVTAYDSYFTGADSVYMCGYYIGNGKGTGMEGSVIARHADPASSTGERYYLFVSYGSLTDTYHMRSFSSEYVYGPYTDINGNQPYYKSVSDSGANNAGNKVMGSFRFTMLDDSPSNEFYAPGHNDLYTTNEGVNLVAYHCRCRQVGDNMHYLYTSQYYFTEHGHLVMNPNRWAGETLRSVSAGELLGKEGELADELASAGYNGEYKMIKLNKNNHTDAIESSLVRFKDDGKIYSVGESGEETEIGTYTLGDRYFVNINLTGAAAGEYEGVVSPAWLTEQNLPGLTLTLIDKATGEALYFNMARK